MDYRFHSEFDARTDAKIQLHLAVMPIKFAAGEAEGAPRRRARNFIDNRPTFRELQRERRELGNLLPTFFILYVFIAFNRK